MQYNIQGKYITHLISRHYLKEMSQKSLIYYLQLSVQDTRKKKNAHANVQTYEPMYIIITITTPTRCIDEMLKANVANP